MKIFLTVLLGIFLLLFLALCIPAGVSFSYQKGKASAVLRWFFLKKRLLPSEKREEGDEKNPAPEKFLARKKKTDGAEKEEKGVSKEMLLSLAKDALPRCIAPIRKLLHRTTIAAFRLSMVICGRDAAETALRYGQTCTAVYSAIAVLGQVFTLKPERIDLYPGFAVEEGDIDLSAEIRLTPLAVLAAGLNLGVIALGTLLRARKKAPRKERKDIHGKQPSHQ